MTSIGDLEKPIVVLREAITWCTSRELESLRTPELGPRVLEASYSDTVRSVVSSRRLRLGRTPLIVDPPPDGRLLAYFPDAELACGSAQSSSDGFFDINNAPPWDTWVLLVEQPAEMSQGYETCLISWVPPNLVERGQAGIDANPEECICWLEDCSPGINAVVCQILSLARE